jgi:hypothetical protein
VTDMPIDPREEFEWITKAHRTRKGWVFNIMGQAYFLNSETGNVSKMKSHSVQVDDANAFTGAVDTRRFGNR